MRQPVIKYSIVKKISAVLMVLALLWLTVSLPFVFASQQEFAKQGLSHVNAPLDAAEDEADGNANPYGNNTEEKSPSTTSVSEEYLHDHHKSDYFFSIISRTHKCENADAYTAYHGEVQVPPPNRA